MDIATAITTAPRQECTLATCVMSIHDSGFSKPFIFAEPGSTILPSTDATTIQNKTRLGAWHNWRTSVEYLLDNTESDLILTIQDDCQLLHPQCRRLVESILWPSPDTGLISLYCPSHYGYSGGKRPKKPGVHRMQVSNIYGACALIFPRMVLECCRKHKLWNTWMGLQPRSNALQELADRRNNPALIKHVDNAISDMILALGRTFWYVIPSLTQHISPYSALGHAPNVGRRMADRIVSPDDNLLELIKPDNLEFLV